MSKYKTVEVWNRVFKEKQEVYDYAGRLMKKSACGNPNSSYPPTLDTSGRFQTAVATFSKTS